MHFSVFRHLDPEDFVKSMFVVLIFRKHFKSSADNVCKANALWTMLLCVLPIRWAKHQTRVLASERGTGTPCSSQAYLTITFHNSENLPHFQKTSKTKFWKLPVTEQT